MSKSVEYVESILKCPICLDVFKKPRNLPCGHVGVFCKECIGKMVKNGMIRCPSCRKTCTLEKVPKVRKNHVPEKVSKRKELKDQCQLCHSSYKISCLWRCSECDYKTVCTKCMKKNHQGKCDPNPSALTKLLEERKAKLKGWVEEWRTWFDNKIPQTDSRTKEMNRDLSSLQVLLCELEIDIGTKLAPEMEKSEKFKKFSQTDSTFSEYMARLDKDAEELHQGMSSMMNRVKLYNWKLDKCAEHMDKIKTILSTEEFEDEEGSPTPQSIPTGLTKLLRANGGRLTAAFILIRKWCQKRSW